MAPNTACWWRRPIVSAGLCINPWRHCVPRLDPVSECHVMGLMGLDALCCRDGSGTGRAGAASRHPPIRGSGATSFYRFRCSWSCCAETEHGSPASKLSLLHPPFSGLNFWGCRALGGVECSCHWVSGIAHSYRCRRGIRSCRGLTWKGSKSGF